MKQIYMNYGGKYRYEQATAIALGEGEITEDSLFPRGIFLPLANSEYLLLLFS